MLSEGTIIALATPQGIGAIGVIRLSGPLSFEKTSVFFYPKSNKRWEDIQSNTTVLGSFVVNKQLIDEVLITRFNNPNSYTGEDVVEIACHGSSYIQQKIISSYIALGIQPAKAGEFTLRAYLNKKMDLSQAEAVSDIIASESKASHEIAIKQMRGGFSKKMEALRKQLIKFKALIELELDFIEEDVSFANKKELKSLLFELHKEIYNLKNSFAYGNVIKNGVPVTIAGKPNAGKSSLLNALFMEEKAIVSKLPGTTRDTIEDTLIIEGILFRFIDTAGLRETDDLIEAIGVQKARDKVTQATLLIYLYERTSDPKELALELKSLYHPGLKIILVENKIDQYADGFNQEFNEKITFTIQKEFKSQSLGISTLKNESIDLLKNELVHIIKKMGNQNDVIVNNTRHFYALTEALIAIESITKGLENDLPGDLLSIELKEAIYHIGTITGEIDTDHDILGSIFGQFCIGK